MDYRRSCLTWFITSVHSVSIKISHFLLATFNSILHTPHIPYSILHITISHLIFLNFSAQNKSSSAWDSNPSTTWPHFVWQLLFFESGFLGHCVEKDSEASYIFTNNKKVLWLISNFGHGHESCHSWSKLLVYIIIYNLVGEKNLRTVLIEM